MLPVDPTVQESIECVFASQLEEGLPSMLLEDDDDNDEYDEYEKTLKVFTNTADGFCPAKALVRRVHAIRLMAMPESTPLSYLSPGNM
jgi:hypothetical protein